MKKINAVLVLCLLVLFWLIASGNLISVAQEVEPTNYALNFDGVDDVVSVPYAASLRITTNRASWTAWLKPSPHLGPKDVIAFFNDTDGWWSIEVFDGELNSTHMEFYARFGLVDLTPVDATWTYNKTQHANNWQFLAATWNGTHARLYVNGTLTDTVNQAGTLYDNIGCPFEIGACVKNNEWNPASLDELLLYNRTLAEAEIRYLWNHGAGRYEPQNKTGLVAWYKFDEGSGVILHDRSGNNNDGTLINGPTWVTGINPDWYSIDPIYNGSTPRFPQARPY